MSILKQFFKNIGYIGIANAAIALKSLILIPIIIKTLGEEDFGIWAQLLVTLYLLLPLATLHLGMALVRFVPVKKDERDIGKHFFTVLLIIIFWSCLLSLIFVTSSKFVFTNFLDLSAFDDYILLIGFILPLWSISMILNSYFRTRLKFNSFAAFTILHNILEILFIFSFIYFGFGIAGALYGIILSFTVINLLMFAYIINEIGIVSPDFSIISEYLSYALPLVPLEFFWLISDSSDKYITGFYLGLGAVGIYAAVYGLSRIVNMFAIPLNFVLGPTLAKHYDRGEIKEVKHLLGISIKMYLLFAIPTVIGFTALARPLLLLLATEKVSENGAIIVPLITLGMTLYGIGAITNQIINLVKKTYVSGIIWGFAAGINVVLNIVLIQYFGIVGPALSTLFTFFFATAIIIIYAKQYLIIPVDWLFIFKCTNSALIMGFSVSLILHHISYSLISTIILVILGIVIYFALLIFSKAIDSREVNFFKQFLK